MASIIRSEKPTTTPKGAGVEERTASTVRHAGGRWRRFSIFVMAVIWITLSLPAKGEIIGLDPEAFYHPGDSTIYLSLFEVYNPYEGAVGTIVLRLKDIGRRIETSRLFRDSTGILFTTHDNVAGHVYAFWVRGMPRNLETSNGGDDWERACLPGDSIHGVGRGAPGENPGESFLTTGIQENGEWVPVVYSTTNSWQTWDTNRVVDNWNTSDFLVCFGRMNGQLIRVERDHGEGLDFSSDTGRTWVSGHLESPLPGYFAMVGTGIEIYRQTNARAESFYCVKDSGRDVSMIFDATDYYDYHHVPQSGSHWGTGFFVPTNIPGEFYAIEDSIYLDGYGIKLHIYHVTNYGQNIEIYYYNMPNYESCEPEAVFTEIHPIPKDAAFIVYPNPCNSTVTIKFALPQGNHTKLSVYDLQGREVETLINTDLQPGYHSAVWNAARYASGVYFYRLESGAFGRTLRMSLVK